MTDINAHIVFTFYYILVVEWFAKSLDFSTPQYYMNPTLRITNEIMKYILRNYISLRNGLYYKSALLYTLAQ